MTTPAPPQFSPDGQWWWNGTQWVPAAQAAAPQGYPPPGYGQPYGQAPGYGYQPYAQPQPTDGKAIASLVLGLIWVWGLGSITAVILGHLSRRDAKKENRAPSGLALAGLILGYVGIAGAALFLSILFVFGDGEVASISRSGTVEISPQSETRTRFEMQTLASAEEAYFVDNARYTADQNELSSYGWPGYSDTVVVLRADSTSFCLQGTAGEKDLYLSNDVRGITDTSCV